MGRCVYEGMYDPNSPLADEEGFRTDVLDAVRDQKYSVIRYPGGNFLSGYNWLDGVGPKGKRPRRRELAWQSIETNQFGTNEFMDLCRKTDAKPMLGVNMGTGTLDRPPATWSSTATRPPAPTMPTCARRTATATRTTCH